jgi:integrative and conjugative element protein (TIGR02256 family)
MIVLVPKPILGAVREAAAKHFPRETGGFLIGLRRGSHIEVTGLTQQSDGDIATRVSFERISPAHREEVHAAWSKSGKTETLVGDWHSHPNGSGRASSTDRRAWRKLARSLERNVIGMIEFGPVTPSLYLVTKSSYLFAAELQPYEEGSDYLAYGCIDG